MKKVKITEALFKDLLLCPTLPDELKDRLLGVKAKSKVKKKVYTTPYKTPEQLREELIINQTPAEKLFKGYLKAAEINYEFQKLVFVEDKFYFIDFFLPEHKLAVEIDGGYHDDLIQKKKDLSRTKDLKRASIVKDILRLRNEEVNSSCIQRLNLFITDSKMIEKRSIEEQRKKYR